MNSWWFWFLFSVFCTVYSILSGVDWGKNLGDFAVGCGWKELVAARPRRSTCHCCEQCFFSVFYSCLCNSMTMILAWIKDWLTPHQCVSGCVYGYSLLSIYRYGSGREYSRRKRKWIFLAWRFVVVWSPFEWLYLLSAKSNENHVKKIMCGKSGGGQH